MHTEQTTETIIRELVRLTQEGKLTWELGSSYDSDICFKAITVVDGNEIRVAEYVDDKCYVSIENILVTYDKFCLNLIDSIKKQFQMRQSLQDQKAMQDRLNFLKQLKNL